MTNPTAATDTFTVIVQDQSQFDHVVIGSWTGDNAMGNALLCMEETVDYGQFVVRKAEGRDIGQVDMNGQLVQGVILTNPDSDETTLLAIVREF